jgi:glycosyltransferase involved in cell wall biosynthesis
MSTSVRTGRTVASARAKTKVVATRPEIALLVSTYQKPWHLERVLTSIAMQRGVEGRIELVVTDDGSTDQTPEIVEQFARRARFPVSFVTHPHETFQLARCRNEGVAESEAPYLLFLDGDCVLPPDHVLRHLERRKPGRAMGAYCCRLDEPTSARFDHDMIRSARYLDWVPRDQLRALARRYRKARFYQWIGHPSKPKLGGGNIAVWRRDYQRVNGYDENFQGWGGEDDDFTLRLRRVGVRVESILRWTRTYHLWHPFDATTPARLRDGANVPYLNRKFRLARCMNGLVKRGIGDLAVRVVGAPSRPQAAMALLESFGLNGKTDEQAEVEILLLPGQGRFSGRADCNVLVVLEDCRRAKRIARKAHVLVADRTYPGVRGEHCFRLTQFDRALQALG